jgi:hypothetical protein
MRRRAYRPEAPVALEGRALLSSVARPPARPVALSQIRYTVAVKQTEMAFQVYNRNRDLFDLREALDNLIVMVPFGRQDGLRPAMEEITGRLPGQLRAGVPHAIRAASNELIAVIHADVVARVRAGDLVIVR